MLQQTDAEGINCRGQRFLLSSFWIQTETSAAFILFLNGRVQTTWQWPFSTPSLFFSIYCTILSKVVAYAPAERVNTLLLFFFSVLLLFHGVSKDFLHCFKREHLTTASHSFFHMMYSVHKRKHNFQRVCWSGEHGNLWTNAAGILFLEPNRNDDKKRGLLLLNKYSPDSDKGSCPVVHSVAWCDRITLVCWKHVTKFCCCLPEVETCKMYTAELTCTTFYVCTYIRSWHAITTW